MSRGKRMNVLRKSIINIFGAIIIFIIFSFHEFLSWIIDKNDNYHFFLLPWWCWGIIGVVLFEIAFFLVQRRQLSNDTE